MKSIYILRDNSNNELKVGVTKAMSRRYKGIIYNEHTNIELLYSIETKHAQIIETSCKWYYKEFNKPRDTCKTEWFNISEITLRMYIYKAIKALSVDTAYTTRWLNKYICETRRGNQNVAKLWFMV